MTGSFQTDNPLARAVERFTTGTQNAQDAELDRAWAWGAYTEEGIRFAFFRTYEELRELAVKTMAERLVRETAPSSTHRILAQYHTAYRDLQAALIGLPVGAEDHAPTAGEWPVRRVVAHIVGAELGFYVAFRFALDRHRTGHRQAAAIPDEVWEEILGQDIPSVEAALDEPLASILAYYAALHEQVLGDLADIRTDELAAPSLYWEGYELSLRFRLHRFDSHLRQHTVQVDKTLEAVGCSPGETKRLLRLIYAALAEVEGLAIGAWDVGTALWPKTAEAIASRAKEIGEILA